MFTDAQADMPLDVDIGFVIDLAYKYVDYLKTRDELCAIMVVILHVEQGPNTAFVYEQYVDMAHAGNKLFVCETISSYRILKLVMRPKEFKFSAWLNKP